MRIRLSPYLVLGLSAAFILSACAETTTKPPEVAASPPVTQSAASPRAMATVSPAPARPAIETGIIPGTLRDFEVNVGDRVVFSYDKSNLDDVSRTTLQRQAAWLSRYGAVTLSIQGHADERGTREYNIALSARRATAVRDYLVSLGVRNDRLATISFGKERPVCIESNEACWSKNRRAVSSITNAAASPNNVAMRN
jgi:peptidoglycan-associated lipoprotein